MTCPTPDENGASERLESDAVYAVLIKSEVPRATSVPLDRG